MSWVDVNERLVLVQPLQPKEVAGILPLLEKFVAANEDLARSPNFENQDADPVDGLVSLLRDTSIKQHPGLALATFKALKILLRKRSNRLVMIDDVNKGEMLRTILQYLQAPSDLDDALAAEAACVILNACYEQENLDVVLDSLGVTRLVAFLSASDDHLRAKAAGALASVCFHSEGRAAVRNAGGIPPLVALLSSDSLKVLEGAVNAIHNASSDEASVRLIWENNGVPLLIELLDSPEPAILKAAAGALQNLSRTVASRLYILETCAVRKLIDLLLDENERQIQVAAAGALLNILGPELGKVGNITCETTRQDFGRDVVCSLVTRMAHNRVY